MKTILVVYSNKKNLTDVEMMRLKRYSFNCDADVEVGDILDSGEYDTPMVVVKVLNTKYKYFNRTTGELSNDFNSTSQWEIRELVILDKQKTNTVYATLERNSTPKIIL